MSQNVLIWDIESAPDLERFAIANDLVGKSATEIREKLGDKFPKHIFHSIICIGALLAHRESTHWKVDAMGGPYVGERTEKALIAAFVDRIAELRPQLITFNGNGYDLPVLRYRAMINEVAAPGLSLRPYFNRYSEDALDLCDVLSSFSSNARATLDETSRAMGLPGKPDGINGSEVESYFLQGRIKEIADYCETDVVNTYRIWLRYELFRGKITDSEYSLSEADLIEFIKERGESKRHLQHFLYGPWRPSP